MKIFQHTSVLSRPKDRQFMERQLEISPNSLPGEQLDLAYAMSEISEEFDFAIWLGGCEFDLWTMVTGGSRFWGGSNREVAAEDIAELKRLSEITGGWIDGYLHFIPLNDWLPIYTYHIANKIHNS